MSVVTASWSSPPSRFGVIVHGGAGRREPGEEVVEGCRRAAEAACAILRAGRGALDAVERAVTLLENDPAYNAGFGAALTEDGEVELDAAIMEGRSLRAGAVCTLRGCRNAIAVARAALEDGRHVLYAGEGALRLARERGVPLVDPASLITPRALAKLERWRAQSDRDGGGTVGAVALDAHGGVAAATSTGGTLGKRAGRVGDSPILGAGTYADERGAASATGHGEGILRVHLTGRLIDALGGGATPEAAAREAIAAMQGRVGSRGGVIVVDAVGRFAFARSTESMPWACLWENVDSAGGGGSASASASGE